MEWSQIRTKADSSNSALANAQREKEALAEKIQNLEGLMRVLTPNSTSCYSESAIEEPAET